jgi:hypothetical protein
LDRPPSHFSTGADTARITNWGTQPVTLNNLSIKAWFDYTGSATLQAASYVNSQSVYTSGGSWIANVNAAAVNFISLGTTDNCGNNRQANEAALINFTDGNTVTIPPNGGYLQTNSDTNSLATWHRSDWANFNYSQDYSRITDAGTGAATRANLSYYTLYLNGNLVCESTSASTQDTNSGQEPCGISACGGGGSKTRRPSADTDVSNQTPTPTPDDKTLKTPQVVAAPNISRDYEPIKFLVNLNKSAQVTLNIYSLVGEKVFSSNLQGTSGRNTLVWDLENNANQSVASGLYVFVVSIDDGAQLIRRVGKVVVIH